MDSSSNADPNLPFSSNSRVRDIHSPTPFSSFLFNDQFNNLQGEDKVELSSLPLLRRLSLEQQSQRQQQQQQQQQQKEEEREGRMDLSYYSLYDHDDSQQNGVKLPLVSTGYLSPVDGDYVSDRDQWILRCTCRYQKVVV